RRSRRERERDERAAVVAAARPPAPQPVVTYTPDLPPPPQYVERQEIVQPTPTPAPPPTPTPTPAPVRLASNTAMLPERFSVDRPAPRPEMAEPQPETMRAQPAPAPTRRIGREDAALASIINGITIPAEELEAVTRAPEREPEPVRTAAPEPVRVAEAAPKPVAPKPKPEVAKPKPEPKAKVDAKAPAKADPKAKTPDAKAGKKPDPKKPDPAKAEPSRVWVQVAGGANPSTLSKAWAAVVAKAPAAMKGKSAWSTPLRATNRVLAGPFKTNAEAQAFVNTLGKAGVSAFVFTSEAGQKVTRLAIK
ncbi:MAG: hypothetical protein EOP61_05825, partial [Sphingomonadales bacterium]